MTTTKDDALPAFLEIAGDHIAFAVAAYNAYRGTHSTISRMAELPLTVDQCFTIVEIGVAANVSPDATHNVVRTLLQQRADIASDLVHRKLVIGGEDVGQAYALSERGAALCATAKDLIKEEITFSLLQAHAARQLHRL